ncbi:MAG: hypothetical protein P8Y44_13275 [Acidobacteriota bacterium]
MAMVSRGGRIGESVVWRSLIRGAPDSAERPSTAGVDVDDALRQKVQPQPISVDFLAPIQALYSEDDLDETGCLQAVSPFVYVRRLVRMS